MTRRPTQRVEAMTRAAESLPPSAYMDYRDWLRAIYANLRNVHTSYSYLLFAEDLGFAPTNVVRLMIVGQRKMTMGSARTIADAIPLRGEEREYFYNLVRLRGERRPATRDQIMADLIRLRLSRPRPEASSREPGPNRDQVEYFTAWFHPVVRECVRIHPAGLTAEEVARLIIPRISPGQAAASLKLLARLGLVSPPDAQGRCRHGQQEQTLVPSDSIVHHFAMVQYHRQMIEAASLAVDELHEDRREVNAMTLALSPESFELLRYRLRDFCQGVMALESTTQERTVVVQLNTQLLAMANRHDKE